MPVTFDNAAIAGTTGGSCTFNITAVANTTLLMFGSGFTGTDGSLSTVVAGVNPMTRIGIVGLSSELWVLSAPPSGVITISANISTATGRWCFAALTYTGVKQINGFGGFVSATGTSVTNLALSVSSTTTDLVIAAFKYNNTAGGAITTGITRARATGSSITLMVAEWTGAPTLSVSATCTTTANIHALGIPLIFSVTNVTTPRFRALLGVGY